MEDLEERYLISADWHLCGGVPRCRLETYVGWLNLQKVAMEEYFNLCITQGAKPLIIGDIFDTPKQSPEILNLFLNAVNYYKDNASAHYKHQFKMESYPKIGILVGNHDLLYRSPENLLKSTIGSLSLGMNDVIEFFDFSYDSDLDLYYYYLNDKILLAHGLITDGAEFPKAITAAMLKERFSEIEYCFSGDNHKAFSIEENGIKIFNPGPLLRHSMTEENYELGAWNILYSNTSNKVLSETYMSFFTDKADLIETVKNSSTSVGNSFVESLKENDDNDTLDLDFLKSLENKINGVNQLVQDYIINKISEIKEGNL